MWLNIVASILSLAVFLGGLHVMRQGLVNMGGGRLPQVIQHFVRTPTRGILTGTVVTALLQSSAAITAICVGMVASRQLLFRDALGVVLGANVGSTVTPQLLSLNLWFVVVPCLILGIAGFISRVPTWNAPSTAMVGFAAVFIGLQALSTALHPLSQSVWFRASLAHAGSNPMTALLTGCIASALIQSSTATTVITMALMSQSLISLPSAIAIVLGANVGTCLTSVIAAIGQSRPAQQVALSHVLLNVGGVLLFLPFLQPFCRAMAWLSPLPAQQLANAHTVFNIACTVALWPLTAKFAHLVERLLPEQRYA